jgi:hypothetical protein
MGIGGGRGTIRAAGLAALLALSLAATACGDSTGSDEFPPLARGTVIGNVTGLGGAPLDSVRVEITVPDELALYQLASNVGLSDAEGGFSILVSLLVAPDPEAPPDTLAIYVTATAMPPRYTPPAGDPFVRDSVLVPVALAASGPVPVSEVHLALPVAAVATRRSGGE